MRLRIGFISAICAILAGSNSVAQSTVKIPLDRPKLGPPVLECSYHSFCQAGTCKGAAFELSLHRNHHGVLVKDGFRRAPITLLEGEDAVSFVEIQSNGSAVLTTVFRNGESSHSRHTHIPTGIVKNIVSQYQGTCTAHEELF